MRQADIFVIAAWAAAIFGLLEGLILYISRAYPVILAPYKVSAHILWIAPVVDLSLFLFAGVGLLILVRLMRRHGRGSELSIIYGLFVFLGVFTIAEAPKIIHWLSAAVLSLGLTVVFCRRLRGFEKQLTQYLRRRLVWIPVLIAVLGLGVLGYEKIRELWLFHQLSTQPAQATNVLVIVMDTVRYDSFTRPAEHSLTPHLDQITAHGVRFENAWATSSWSLPSQASLLTGRYPHEHGADWPHLRLDEKYPTLGELFARRGYITGAFSGNAAWMTPEYLGRGFLRFEVYIVEDLLRRTVHGRKIDRLLWGLGYHYAGRGKKAPQLNAQFLQFLDDYRGHPFFAYLCYMDVNRNFHHRKLNHGFWEPITPTREIVAAYEQGLQRLDSQIGDLFTTLEQRGILKNTVVIITSDHGESFGREGSNDHDTPGHGTSLYPEQLKVPLFVVSPEKLSAGQQIMSTVSLQQIPATIVHLLAWGDSPFVGEPLPLVQEHEPASHHHGSALASLNYGGRKIRSVIWHQWQYIDNSSNPQIGEELYDLAADPLAKTNLAATHPFLIPMQKRLRQLLAVGSHVSGAVKPPELSGQTTPHRRHAPGVVRPN